MVRKQKEFIRKLQKLRIITWLYVVQCHFIFLHNEPKSCLVFILQDRVHPAVSQVHPATIIIGQLHQMNETINVIYFQFPFHRHLFNIPHGWVGRELAFQLRAIKELESAYKWIIFYDVGAETDGGTRRTCCSKRAARRWVIPPTTRPPRFRASGSWSTCSLMFLKSAHLTSVFRLLRSKR